MTAPQTGTYPGTPRPVTPPTAPGQLTTPPEPPTKQELVRQQLVGLALLFLLTAITLGVTASSMDVFWMVLRFFLVLYTLLAWIVWLMNWRTGT